MSTETLEKDAAATEGFVVPWKRRLGTAVLVASSFAVPAGLNKVSETFDDTTATVRLAGGTVGTPYVVTNTVTTSTGEVLVYHFTIVIV